VAKGGFPSTFLDPLFSLRAKGGIPGLTRKDKEKEVAWLREEFRTVRGLFLTDFQGLTVGEMNALRTALRQAGAKYKVLKNTLVRMAYQDTDVSILAKDMVGPRAAAWIDVEEKIPTLAKVLVDFAKGNPKLQLVRGMVGRQVIDPAEMDSLSKLPSREELRARLLGAMIAPVTALVNTFAAVPRSFLNVLKAIEEQKDATQGSSAS
jgi:large subunit ribosomal protein L10